MPESVKTLNQMLLEAMDRYSGEPCLFIKQNRLYQSLSYRQFRSLAFRLAHGFQERGLQPGERLVLIGRNTLEWLLTFVAGHLLGAITVPLRATLPPDLLLEMAAEAEPALAVVQGAELSRLLAGAGIAGLQAIFAVGLGEKDQLPPAATPLASLLAENIPPESESVLRTRALAAAPGDLSAIHFVTTDQPSGPPLLGALFDQGQEAKALQSMAEWFPLDEDDIGFTTPQQWTDLPNLQATLRYFLSGVANALSEGEETNFEDLQHISPTVTLTSPYAFEYIYLRVMAEMEQMPRSSQEVFQWALAVGKEYHAAGLSASAELRESYRRADMTFFSNIRGAMGGRLRRLYSAGAPLPSHWVDFAEAIGLLPINVYSVTKAGGFPAASRPGGRRTGSCGRIAPGFQIRIADDGEVLVRGDTVTRGYWRRGGEVRRAVDADGWLHTGDLGRFDNDGYLYLTGHKQSSLVLATGRKVVPAVIEDRLVRSPFIAQAYVCGEGRRYISALIVPDLGAVQARLWEEGRLRPGQGITADHPELRALVDQAVQDVNRTLDGWEQIERYTLLDHPFRDAGGQPITNVAQQRKLIAHLYCEQLEAMYPAAMPFEERVVTQVQLEPEHLRQLLEKEDILDAWVNDAGIGFLFELARAKQIDAPSMVHICETVAAIAQMQNEERPVSTALIVGNPTRIGRVLPEGALQLRQYDHIRRMRRTVTSLAKIVDGQVLGFAVDNHGFVRGIHRLEVALEQTGSDLTGAQFRQLAAISRHCDAVVFSVPSGGRQVRVFADGFLVGRYINGSWLAEDMVQIDTVVVRLAERKQVDEALLRRLLRCAYKLSERNLGAILMVGDAEAILRRSDKPEIQNVAAIHTAPLDDISDEELIAYARQDGATVIDRCGELWGCMILLRPAATTQAQVGPGKGARHSSAAKMSAETDCIAITVSQDGPIAVYESGQRVLSL
ncbi:MAG TPA: AMP-binding protein [Caldilineaceae bacterium]|nr:AMP-binding protein [Caldilineaceae bacterium]